MRSLFVAAALALSACTGPSAGSAATSADQKAMGQTNISGFKADMDAGKVKALFDVRTPGEFSGGHVKGAVNVPVGDLGSRMNAFEPHKGDTIYLICQSGGRSARAGQMLAAQGYDVVNVQGGTGGWIAAGHPVE